ncbi:glucokinase [soil metagenome]
MTGTNIQAEKLVGIEVSGSMLKSVSLDMEGKITGNFQAPIFRKEETASQLIEFIADITEKFGDFEKVGIAVPGLLNLDTQRVAFSTHFPEHEKIDLVGELKSVIKHKVIIENDANAAAYGEFRLGAGRGSRNMFYVTLGKGVGGALIFNGEIWHGAAGFAGEFGHIAINEDGIKLEDVASAANIVRRTRSRFHQDSTSSLGSLDEDDIGIADLVREAENGDEFARLMLERTGNYVGMAVAGVINLLNIEKIVVGGLIMQAEHLVLDSIMRRAQELSFLPSFDSTQILKGALNDNATAIGAALLSEKL